MLSERLLTRQETLDAAAFAAAALALLFLPDRAIDSWGVVNPVSLGQTLVVLMGFSLAGYWAVRFLGAQFGLLVAGFAAGFVSSSMGIAAMGGNARDNVALSGAAAAGAIASILGSLIYLTALVATADASILGDLSVPFGCAVAPTLSYAAFLTWRARFSVPSVKKPDGAYHFKSIAVFVALVVAFGFVSTLLASRFGKEGVLASAAVTGLVDAHATAVSMAELVSAGKIGQAEGAFAILIGLSANMAIKIPAAFALGPRAFSWRVSAALTMLLGCLWCGYALQRGGLF